MNKLKEFTWERAVLVVALVAVFVSASGPTTLGLVLASALVTRWIEAQKDTRLLADTARLAAVETEVRALSNATTFQKMR